VFVGHFALAFAAKKIAPQGSLATYMAATQLSDVIWPFLILSGTERVSIAPGDTAFNPLRFDSYPVSHSLATDVLWGLLFAALVYVFTRSRPVAWVSAGLVVSHWLLDLVSHRPDMPILPGVGQKYGLGLWNSVAATVATEILMLVVGVGLYLSATRPRDGVGRWGLVGLLAFILLAYLGAAFGPPPPSVSALGTTAILGAVLILGASAWIDRHRLAAPAKS
jgi:hypothetical protein